jgi:hypothetical protein
MAAVFVEVVKGRTLIVFELAADATAYTHLASYTLQKVGTYEPKWMDIIGGEKRVRYQEWKHG